MRKLNSCLKAVVILGIVCIVFFYVPIALAEVTQPPPDQTPSTPLSDPDPALVNPRYISGFGMDNNYTIFYEDRNAGCAPGQYTIYFNQTTTGAMGFSNTSTATDICDTHFTASNEAITIPLPHPSAGTYAYRGWASAGNNPNHNFYVSNNLTNWTLINTFTFNDPGGVLNAGENVYYGFHDVIEIKKQRRASAPAGQHTMPGRSTGRPGFLCGYRPASAALAVRRSIASTASR